MCQQSYRSFLLLTLYCILYHFWYNGFDHYLLNSYKLILKFLRVHWLRKHSLTSQRRYFLFICGLVNYFLSMTCVPTIMAGQYIMMNFTVIFIIENLWNEYWNNAWWFCKSQCSWIYVLFRGMLNIISKFHPWSVVTQMIHRALRISLWSWAMYQNCNSVHLS